MPSRLSGRCAKRFRVHYALNDAEEVDGAARQPVYARHSHHVAGGKPPEHAQKLAPVGPRTVMADDSFDRLSPQECAATETQTLARNTWP